MTEIDRRLAIIGLGAAILSAPKLVFAQQAPSSPEEQKTDLEVFLSFIQPEQERISAIVTEHSEAGIQLLPYLSPELFNRNYPFWMAGQLKHRINWLILAITHGEETHFSTHPNPNGGQFRGAMQRQRNWPESQTFEAADGLEFLAELPQGYPSDWKEIPWAAWYIRVRADKLISRFGDFEEASLQSLYQYCSPPNAANRIRRYRNLKPILLL